MKKTDWVQRKKHIKRSFFALGIGFSIAGVWVVPSFAAPQVGTFEGHPVFESNLIEGVEVEESQSRGNLKKRGAGFAAQYDPRITHQVSVRIEDQGNTEACWAFSTIAAIEANLIKKGYEDENVNLSENHLAYFFYNRATDPIGDTMGDNNIGKSPSWELNGGTLQGTALSLTTWAGVVRETVLEDYNNGEYKPEALPASACYNSDYRVAGTYFYNYSVADVKQAITDYGAVAAGIYMPVSDQEAAAYWNAGTASYNCTKNGGNHAVAIVGWDDSYSRDNFSSVPGSDGAWIVKNSYGSGFGDNGYMYVSYEDASLAEIVAFDMVSPSESYAHNYQYDGSANPATYLRLPGGTTCANVFQAKASAGGYNEVLQAVSVDVLTTNVRYNLQIYTGLSATGSPTSGTAMLTTPQSGTLTNAGYNQITLQTPVMLTSGERYAVVLTLSDANGGAVLLACDSNLDAEWIKFQATVGSGQSYIYTYDSGRTKKRWFDYGDVSQVGGDLCNLRIKAYTNDTNIKTTYGLSEKNLGLSKGSSKTLTVNFNPASARKDIIWTSSNKKVATVNSKGKVKGKSYGTATIKAQFRVGASMKTLKCKVTVGPSKVTGFKVKGGKKKIIVTWKKSEKAQGYVIYYSKEKDSGYKKLATINGNLQTKYTRKKLKAGTYYVKMCPYLTKNGKKLYGSDTTVKTVTVK